MRKDWFRKVREDTQIKVSTFIYLYLLLDQLITDLRKYFIRLCIYPIQQLYINFTTKNMSDSQPSPPKHPITLSQLQPHPYPVTKSHSAFSTAAHKTHLQATHDNSGHGTGFTRNVPVVSGLAKFREAIQQYERQCGEGIRWRKVEYMGRENGKDGVGMAGIQGSQGKENDYRVYNSDRKDGYGVAVGTTYTEKKIVWETPSKNETAEIVRKLYKQMAVDYNFQYRKKKFFQNFKP